MVKNIWGNPGEKWRGILVNWRNRFIHGRNTWAPKAFGVYTNYICLVLWYMIPLEIYDVKCREILDGIEMDLKMGIRSPWRFYPPFF